MPKYLATQVGCPAGCGPRNSCRQPQGRNKLGEFKTRIASKLAGSGTAPNLTCPASTLAQPACLPAQSWATGRLGQRPAGPTLCCRPRCPQTLLPQPAQRQRSQLPAPVGSSPQPAASRLCKLPLPPPLLPRGLPRRPQPAAAPAALQRAAGPRPPPAAAAGLKRGAAHAPQAQQQQQLCLPPHLQLLGIEDWPLQAARSPRLVLPPPLPLGLQPRPLQAWLLLLLLLARAPAAAGQGPQLAPPRSRLLWTRQTGRSDLSSFAPRLLLLALLLPPRLPHPARVRVLVALLQQVVRPLLLQLPPVARLSRQLPAGLQCPTARLHHCCPGLLLLPPAARRCPLQLAPHPPAPAHQKGR